MTLGAVVRVGPDMGIEQEGLAVFEQTIGVLEVGLAFADRLDLAAAQGYAGLEPVEQEVVMAGGSIDDRVAFARGHRVARFGLLRRGRTHCMCRLARHL